MPLPPKREGNIGWFENWSRPPQDYSGAIRLAALAGGGVPRPWFCQGGSRVDSQGARWRAGSHKDAAVVVRCSGYLPAPAAESNQLQTPLKGFGKKGGAPSRSHVF
jgi:hypothetical protein